MLVLRLAWRNVWRNGGRTAITLATVALATAILVLTHALMVGMTEGAVRNATDILVGEVQAHAPGWMRDHDIHTSLADPAALLRAAAARGVAATARAHGYGLVAHGTKSAGAFFSGVDPAAERGTLDLPRHVLAGHYLADAPAGGAVIGRKLARSLGVGPGDELVVVVQAADGSLGNELFTVTGVLETMGEAVDRSAMMLHRADFDSLFVADGRVHEVVFNSRGRVPVADVQALAAAAAPGADIRPWRQLVPILNDMLAMMNVSLLVFDGVFALAAGLGVLNTMLMATWDRLPELGVLRALGTTPWRLARDVVTEATVVGGLGAMLGAGLGAAGAAWLQTHGIDTSAWAGTISVGGVAFDPVWRAALRFDGVAIPLVMIWVTTVVATLYPAVLAARLDPVRAMQRV